MCEYLEGKLGVARYNLAIYTLKRQLKGEYVAESLFTYI